MNTRNQNRRGRGAAHPALAPITRAIRHSLFASATLAALALPATALAGSACLPMAALHCQSAQAQLPLAQERVDDPSVVLDGIAPQSVQPLAMLMPTAGVVVTDPYAATLVNADAIPLASYADGDTSAYGAFAESDGFSYLTNTDSGIVDVVARSVYGDATAVGLYAAAGISASLWNYGAASATASSISGTAQAYAAVVAGMPAGIGLLVNGGDLQATATAGDGGVAQAAGAYVVADVASIFNDASIEASAVAGVDGSATARGAASYSRYSGIYNYGDMVVSANGGLAANATGIEATGIYGVTAYNAGSIGVDAVADGSAAAIGSSAIATMFGAYSTNNGNISVHADAASAQANGLINASLNYGDAITHNSGDIEAVAIGGIAGYGETEAVAQGVYNLAAVYGAAVYNDGAISATALALADISGTYGFLQAKAIGAQAISVYGYGDTLLANAGDIDAAAMASQGYASAWGAVAQTSGRYGGTATLDNSGGIHANAYADVGVANALGAYVLNQGGDVVATNYGDIDASARAERGIVNVSVNYAYATGVKLASYYGSVSLDNHASIAATASAEGAITGARGVQVAGGLVSITNAEGASITATGAVDLFGGGFATGIEASGVYGITIANDGDIDVYGHAHAYSDGVYGFYGTAAATGIYASANTRGNVAITNNGAITAFANAEDSLSFVQGGAGATGVNAYAKYDASIVNAGDISAIARSEFGISSAHGVIGHGKYTTHVVNAAGASILAEASAGSLAGDSYDGRAVTFGVHVFGRGMEYGLVENDGSIASHASVTSGQANATQGLGIASAWGASVGAYSDVIAGGVVNHGDIEATASADFGSATAYGSYILTATHANTSNQGTIFASADASHGYAWSVGSIGRAVEQEYHVPCVVVDGPYGPYNQCDYSNAYFVTVGGDAALDNAGQIGSIARAAGGAGDSYGAVSLGGFYASITNSGRIDALAEADDAQAVGALANALYGTASIDNSGSINAVARGDLAVAKGVDALGREGGQVNNSGTITATATGADATATAVAMEASGHNVLANTGTIAAFGDGTRIAVSSAIDASADISNSGSLLGAVVTGDLDDRLVNAAGGSWLALGASAFGGGDDAIDNAGTLRMQDASIDLGAEVATLAAGPLASAGNSFVNSGLIVVAGDNAIDMGGAFAFTNNGAISFVDGAADDTLVVTGELAGNGTLRFDADLAGQVGDRLQLAGGMAAGSTQVVDIQAFGAPVSARERIDLVTASGPLAGSFTLGTLNYRGSGFLSQQFSLAQDANTLVLESEVTGLNAAGALAANVASGAVDMLNAQVGTFKQRLGVDPYGDGDAVMSAFFRSYASEGDVNPAHMAADFGQAGDFAHAASSWGREFGVNANLSANLHAGLTFGSGSGRQRMAVGAGSNRMEGSSFGVYATWLDPQGLYVDLSARWMAMDVDSASSMGLAQARVRTSAWNLEAGYQWAVGGFNIVPQLQYTRAKAEDVGPLSGQGMEFEGEGGTSRRARLGVELNASFQSGRLRWTPYGSINAVREFDGEMGYAVGNFHGSTSTKGSSVMADLGVGLQAGRWSATLGANWLDGGAYKGSLGGQAVVRFRW